MKESKNLEPLQAGFHLTFNVYQLKRFDEVKYFAVPNNKQLHPKSLFDQLR